MNNNSLEKPAEEILCININQDQTCMACGTESGFKIFSLVPWKETYSRELGGGIGIIEMLFQYQVQSIGEMSFRTDVRAVQMKIDRIIVALETQIFVYNFTDLKLLDHIETSPNPFGLISINVDSSSNNTILACPDKIVGHVYIRNYNLQLENRIKAHESHLNSLQLNTKGSKLATASQKGTIIRIYNTLTFQLIQEVRRGSEYANIQSIAFHSNSQFLACCSDSGTIHIFGINLTDEEKKENEDNQTMQEIQNPKSKLSFMKSLIPFFNSEWSLAQYRIAESQSRVCFGPEYTVIAIAFDGKYYHAGFDPVGGGDCVKIEDKNFNTAKE